jgi:hypothetical protein
VTLTATIGTYVLTVLGNQVFFTTLPRATLGAAGVTVDLGPDGYPGKAVAAADLRSTLQRTIGDDRGAAIMLIVPAGTPAHGLVPIIDAAIRAAPVYLAAQVREAPEGWDLAGGIPVSIDTADPTVKLGRDTTTQQLADILAKAAVEGTKRVGVIAQ